MATAEASGQCPADSSKPTFITGLLETLCEIGLIAIIVLSRFDEGDLPPGYRDVMLLLAVALLVLLLVRKSELLLVPAWGLVTGFALGLVLTTARYRWVADGEMQFFKQGEWWGVRISWAGAVASSIAVVYLIRSAADRFRNLAANPFALAMLVAAVVMSVVEAVLVIQIRGTGTTQLLDAPFAFLSLAIQYAVILMLCSWPGSLWRARRLALFALCALAIRILIPGGGPDGV